MNTDVCKHGSGHHQTGNVLGNQSTTSQLTAQASGLDDNMFEPIQIYKAKSGTIQKLTVKAECCLQIR